MHDFILKMRHAVTLTSSRHDYYSLVCLFVSGLRPDFSSCVYVNMTRNLDFSKGHQGITGDKEGQHRRLRQQRLIFTGKWIADNQPRYRHSCWHPPSPSCAWCVCCLVAMCLLITTGVGNAPQDVLFDTVKGSVWECVCHTGHLAKEKCCMYTHFKKQAACLARNGETVPWVSRAAARVAVG